MSQLKAKIILKREDISEKEKSDRVFQFQKAVTTAAVGFYSEKYERS